MTDRILYTTAQCCADLETAGMFRSVKTLRVWASRFPMQMPDRGHRGRETLYDLPDVLKMCQRIEDKDTSPRLVEWLLTVWDCQRRAAGLSDRDETLGSTTALPSARRVA